MSVDPIEVYTTTRGVFLAAWYKVVCSVSRSAAQETPAQRTIHADRRSPAAPRENLFISSLAEAQPILDTVSELTSSLGRIGAHWSGSTRFARECADGNKPATARPRRQNGAFATGAGSAGRGRRWDSPCRHCTCRRRFRLAACCARDNPVFGRQRASNPNADVHTKPSASDGRAATTAGEKQFKYFRGQNSGATALALSVQATSLCTPGW